MQTASGSYNCKHEKCALNAEKRLHITFSVDAVAWWWLVIPFCDLT